MLSSRAEQKYALWKNRLLDLSSQNRQLYFQPKGRDVIQIMHPPLATLFKILVELGQSCSFPPIFKRKRGSKVESEQQEKGENDAENIASIQQAFETRKSTLGLTELVTYFDDDTLRNRLSSIIQKAQDLENDKGINPLYLVFGLIKWKDPVLRSEILTPLMFLPIKIRCESVQTPFELMLMDDEIIINPLLKEKLRNALNISLPSFDEIIQMYSLRNYIEKLRSLLPEGILVVEESYIALFSGSKIALFNDMDSNQTFFITHPIIKALVEEQGYIEPSDHIPSAEALSDNANPWDSYTILDADSSQMEAIKFAVKGSSLIIQGPPGTGKSQCISNIIAECLGVGKKVLFVAEKKAAIEVVHDRLQKCGLGDFCVEIHSLTPKKADIMNNIGQSINTLYHQPPVRVSKYSELLLQRQRIDEYVEVINRLRGNAKFSIFEMMGRDLSLSDIPLLAVDFPDPYQFTENDLIVIEDVLHRLESYRQVMERYSAHPWFSANLQSFPEGIKEILASKLTQFGERSHQFIHNLQILQEKRKKASLSADQIGIMASSEVFKGEAMVWAQQFRKATYWRVMWELWPLWQDYQHILHDLSSIFGLKDPTAQFEPFEYFQRVIKAPLGVSFEEYINKNLLIIITKIPILLQRLNHFNEKYRLHPISSEQELIIYTDFLRIYYPRALLLKTEDYLSLFTGKYKNPMNRLGGNYHRDRAEILKCVRNPHLKDDIADILMQLKECQDYIGTNVDPSIIDELGYHIDQIHAIVSELAEPLEVMEPLLTAEPLRLDLESTIWQENWDTTKGWLTLIDQFNEWAEVQLIRNRLRQYHLEPFFQSLIDKFFPQIRYVELFRKIFTRKFLSKAIISEPHIENFDAEAHEKLLEDFRTNDEDLLLLNQERLRQQLYAIRPRDDLQLTSEMIGQLGFLKRETQKKKNIKSIRTIFSTAQECLSLLKPCIMMSPISVANFLDLEKYKQFFDVVIFDEASQVTTEDALGAIVRGKQLIVVGDSQQLPPTQFFATKVDDSIANTEIEAETMESLLEECTGIGLREKILRYHYRSRKEGLISFSNTNFYNDRLYTFPDLLHLETGFAVSSDMELNQLPAIEFCYIKDGLYENRRNIVEARAVAQAVQKHFEYNKKHNIQLSLGIVAFSQSQQETIQRELDDLIQRTPNPETFQMESTEPLFIKNLENVQGDERDIMFISVGYGRNPSGHIGLNFGPINQAGGYRRLNVIITRARYHLKLFCSFLPNEINRDKVQAEGLRYLLEYIEFAQNGAFNLKTTTKMQKIERTLFELPFERQVKAALESVGFTVVERVGKSSFKIDLAVVHPKDSSRYILAIQCDGGSYSQVKNARDRDRIRPQILSGLGWGNYHIWAPEWYSNSNKIIKKIQILIQEYIDHPPIPPKVTNKSSISKPAPILLPTNESSSASELNIDSINSSKKKIEDGTIFQDTQISGDLNRLPLDERILLFNIPGIVHYTIFQFTTPLAQDIFFQEDSKALIEIIKQILSQEGPVHIEIFQKRLMSLFDFKRITPKIAEKIKDLQNIFIIMDDFIGLSTQTNPDVRLCENPALDPRSFFQIHPIELQNAMQIVLRQLGRLKKAELFSQTLKLYGITAVRKNYLPRLDELLERLISKGEVQNVGNFLSMK